MVSVCLPSDALLLHLPSYLSFSYLGHGVCLHSYSSKVQPLLLTLDEGYLLTASLPDLQPGIAPLGPPAPWHAWLLGSGVGPPGRHPWPQVWGCSSRPLPLALGMVLGSFINWMLGNALHKSIIIKNGLLVRMDVNNGNALTLGRTGCWGITMLFIDPEQTTVLIS